MNKITNKKEKQWRKTVAARCPPAPAICIVLSRTSYLQIVTQRLRNLQSQLGKYIDCIHFNRQNCSASIRHRRRKTSEDERDGTLGNRRSSVEHEGCSSSRLTEWHRLKDLIEELKGSVELDLDPTRRLFDRWPWIIRSPAFDKAQLNDTESSQVVHPNSSSSRQTSS